MNIKRSTSFNEVAEIYDLVRPSYPSDLIEDVVEMANLPDSAKILDIGTGTGKGTIPFAKKGYAIHCLEPGEKLITIATQNMRSYPHVTFETVTFEDWNLRSNFFDLAISAQAFHWVNREIGYPKVAQALKQNGHIAFFWNFSTPPRTPIFQALNEAYQKYVPLLVSNPPSISLLNQKRENWILDSKCFKDLVIKQYPWSASKIILARSAICCAVLRPLSSFSNSSRSRSLKVSDFGANCPMFSFLLCALIGVCLC